VRKSLLSRDSPPIKLANHPPNSTPRLNNMRYVCHCFYYEQPPPLDSLINLFQNLEPDRNRTLRFEHLPSGAGNGQVLGSADRPTRPADDVLFPGVGAVRDLSLCAFSAQIGGGGGGTSIRTFVFELYLVLVPSQFRFARIATKIGEFAESRFHQMSASARSGDRSDEWAFRCCRGRLPAFHIQAPPDESRNLRCPVEQAAICARSRCWSSTRSSCGRLTHEWWSRNSRTSSSTLRFFFFFFLLRVSLAKWTFRYRLTAERQK
jgi:hypothetical protein